LPMRPCWVEIRTRSLEENYRYLVSLATPDAELLAIVKANAYGHSLEICAPAAVRAGAKWLGVACVEEAVAARAVCPEARILVIGSAFPGQGAEVVANGLTPAVWETWQLDELEAAARAAGLRAGSLPVHMELDTGMSRQGVDEDTIGPVLARFTPESPLKLEGVMTHLYAADETDGRVTKEQLARVEKALQRLEGAGLYAEWLNVGSSAALMAGETHSIVEMAARHGMKAMIRPGLVLYGLAPRFEPDEPASVAAARARLQPVLSWKTRVAGVRSISAGTTVGYNGTFVATEPMRLALLSVGYADGLDRKLGNHFSLLVGGQRAPLVGRVSMDQSVVDVTDIPGVKAGDDVVILGTQGNETVSAFDHADVEGTIPWEVFTRIGQRVRRIEV
jgi:alanine racemase